MREAVETVSGGAQLNDRVLKATEIAAFLGCSRSRAHELMANGTLPAIRIGRSIRVSQRSLELWVREQEQRSRRNAA